MRNQLVWGVAIALWGSAASAAVKTVPIVDSGSAGYSINQKHTILLRAKVELANGCWSNPRLKEPIQSGQNTGPTVPFLVVADFNDAPGAVCAQDYRKNVDVPRFEWTNYPARVRKVKFIGSKRPVTVTVARTGH